MLSLSAGPLALGLDQLLLLASLLLASLVGWWVARRGGSDPQSVLFNLLLIGLMAARGGFVVRYWPDYRLDPWQILDPRDGGFLAWPGVLAVLLAAAFRAWRNPALRRPLGVALGCGLLCWGLGSLALHLYERGASLPDLVLQDAAGRPVRLADYRGRPLVVNLWASWCPPCRREMPVLRQAQRERGDLTFLFVNQAEQPSAVEGLLASQAPGLRNLLYDGNGSMARAVGAGALPTTLFYDAEGRLLGSRLGELSRGSLARHLEAFGTTDAPVHPVRSTER